MLQSYESRWAIDFQRHHKDFDPVQEFEAFYRPLKLMTQSSIDVVSTEAPLENYALVVAPALNVISERQALRLAEYVRKGGHLVLGPRTGMKDPYDALWPQRQPGPLETLLGARVQQFYALDQPITVSGVVSGDRAASEGTPSGNDRQASIWAETLEVLSPDAHVWMTYDEGQGWLSGKPAAITRNVGKGSITYIGAWLSAGPMQTATAHLLEEAGVAPMVTGLPTNSSLEICERAGDGKRIWIIINHGAHTETLTLPVAIRRFIVGSSNGVTGNHLQLAPHDVVVVDVSDEHGAHKGSSR